MTTKQPVQEYKVANVVEIVRENLRVDVRGMEKARTLLPTLRDSTGSISDAST